MADEITVERRSSEDTIDFFAAAMQKVSRGREHFHELQEREVRELERSLRSGGTKTVSEIRIPMRHSLHLMSLRAQEFVRVDADLTFGPTFLPRHPVVQQCLFLDCQAIGWRVGSTTFRDCRFEDFRTVASTSYFSSSTFERCTFANFRPGQVTFRKSTFRDTTFTRWRGGRPIFRRCRLDNVTIAVKSLVLVLDHCQFRSVDLRKALDRIMPLRGQIEDVVLPRYPTGGLATPPKRSGEDAERSSQAPRNSLNQ